MNRRGQLPQTRKSGGRNIRRITAIGYSLYSRKDCSVKTVESEGIEDFQDDVHVSIESEVEAAQGKESSVCEHKGLAGYINCLGKLIDLGTRGRYLMPSIAS